MIATLPYPVALALVGAAGLATHEVTHYVAATLAGDDPRFTVHRPGVLPAPAVRVDTPAFSPATWAATTLAPAVVCTPSLAAVAVLAPTGEALGLWVMWLLATLPSPSDWRQAYHADAVAVERTPDAF